MGEAKKKKPGTDKVLDNQENQSGFLVDPGMFFVLVLGFNMVLENVLNTSGWFSVVCSLDKTKWIIMLINISIPKCSQQRYI